MHVNIIILQSHKNLMINFTDTTPIIKCSVPLDAVISQLTLHWLQDSLIISLTLIPNGCLEFKIQA